jgi:hypothetical protein
LLEVVAFFGARAKDGLARTLILELGETMHRIETEMTAQDSRRPRWRTPVLTLDTMVNATGSDLNQPGDDGQTVYPGIDLGQFS